MKSIEKKPHKLHTILVEEDKDGLIGMTCGTFPVSFGEAETEVDIDDIPIRLEDITYQELIKSTCMSCERYIFTIHGDIPTICPFCGCDEDNCMIV